MTLLIIFLSVANIALGYGLAIYLGHAQIPGALGKRTTNYCPATSGEESRDARNDYTGTIDQENNENQNEVAAEAVAETADEVWCP